SADKHGIPREDALYAMMHYVVSAEIDGEPGETTVLYIGHPHEQTDRYLEVIAAHIPPAHHTHFPCHALIGHVSLSAARRGQVMSTTHEALARRAERGELTVKPGT